MLGLGLAPGFSYAEAIALANVAAGLSVERIGVTVVTRQEIIEDLVRHRPPVRDKLILSREALNEEMNLLRAAGRRIVFTNGCFDLLHVGHLHVLREARKQGDVLVVGLNSDDSIRRLNKGDGRPINPQLRRASVLAGLEAVDYIYIFDEETPADLVRAVRPHVMVKGADYRPEQIAGWDFVQSYGGRLHLVELLPDTSTTGTIEQIKKT
ncbi:MAG: D-glycero-beta-D-manno-heptose 1-phosphate adenylyltransferase [Phycisphaerales bacterium]|nr:D-glycero-beta-D-manno-heptose 1-phosphate adenylyltransferase [Phycisphaerales bacterium]